MVGSDAYFEKILGQVKQSIDASNTVIGEYMCQGKMPQSVRERYVKMKENPEHPANLDLLIQILTVLCHTRTAKIWKD